MSHFSVLVAEVESGGLMDVDVNHHGNSGSFEADLLNWRPVVMMSSFIFTN